MIRRAIVTLLLTLALPTAAHAATVSVYVPPCALEQSKYGACYPDEARFAAAAGEQNKVTVEHATSDPPSYSPRLTLKDDGAPLTAGAGCTQVDEHTVSCTGYSLIARVDAGDGGDTVDGVAYEVDGGPGNDVLGGAQLQHGGPGDDKLQAGDTGAFLDGGPGHDTITGGKGSDTVRDDTDPGEQDVVDGGEGADTMSYAGRKTPVTVSLVEPSSNEDRLTAIESVTGGIGDDKLTGDAAANTLAGGAGRDELRGGDGNDTLAGDQGPDYVNGDAGNDHVDAGAGFGEVWCGTGADRAEPRSGAEIGWDCERVGIDDFDLEGVARLRIPPRSASAPILTFEPLACVFLPCSVRMTISGLAGRINGKILGEVRAVQRSRRHKLPGRITLRLNAAGRAHLRRHGRLAARVRIAVTEEGERNAASFLVEIPRPRARS